MPDFVEMVKSIAVNAVNATNPVALVFGTVKKVSPLAIKISDQVTLYKEMLIVPKHLNRRMAHVQIEGTTRKTEITYPPFESLSHTHGIGNEYPIKFKVGDQEITISGEVTDETTFYFPDFPPNYHNHEVSLGSMITIYEGLQVGDKTALLRMQGGQQYFVLGVVE